MTHILCLCDDDTLTEDVELIAASVGLAFTRDPRTVEPGRPPPSLIVVDGGAAAQVVLLDPTGRSPRLVVGRDAASPQPQIPALADAEYVCLPAGTARLSVLFADLAGPARAVTVGVLGCAGGVGTSTLAAALARAAPGAALIDLDPHGAGLDACLGTETLPGVRWSSFDAVDSPLVGSALVESLPRWGSTRLLGRGLGEPVGAGLPAVARQNVLRALRAEFDLIVGDLGRGCLAADVDALLLVLTPTVGAVVTAERVAAEATGRVGCVWVGQEAPGHLELDQVAVWPRRRTLADPLDVLATSRTQSVAGRALRWAMR